MIEIGLSGGIGSGKTSASRIFQNFGIPIYNADLRAKKLMSSNQTLISQITQLFGKQAYSNGILQTRYIAQHIFSNPQLKTKLEKLVHPAVYHDYTAWTQNQSESIVIHENALMFANDSYKKFHATIFVYCPQDLRILRIMIRDSITKEQAMQRILAQPDDKSCLEKATYTITNDNSMLMIPQILQIYAHIKTHIHG